MNKKIRIKKKIKIRKTRKIHKIIVKIAKAKVIIGVSILLVGIWIFYEITKPKVVAVTEWFYVPTDDTQNTDSNLDDKYRQYQPIFKKSKK